MQNLVEDKFDLRSHGSNYVFLWGDHTIFFRESRRESVIARDYTLLAIAYGV